MVTLAGVFGGRFDPVHNGHLRTALELAACAGLDEVRFVPTGRPPHRDGALAPAGLRLAMLKAAIAGQRGFVADDVELTAARVSYTVDTLAELALRLPDRRFCLLLGMDAFTGFPGWRDPAAILGRCHLVVARRPGYPLPPDGPAAALLAERAVDTPEALRTHASGAIFVCETPQLDIASSRIRRLMAAGGDPRWLVPDAVREMLLDTHCYQEEARPGTAATEVTTGAKP